MHISEAFEPKSELVAYTMANVVASDGIDITQTFVNLFETKNKEGYTSCPITEEDLQPLAGRVVQGTRESDFEYLVKTWTGKKVAWVMGGDGLILFLKYSNVNALRAIGFEDRWMRTKLESGNRFRLGIFYQSDQCVPGTWDGILSVIDKHYPKSISMKVFQHGTALKETSFDEIETRARLSYLRGDSYYHVDTCRNDTRYMTDERFSECEGTLEECRGFLYHRLCLTGLFDGSGFTKDESGKLHVREYLQLNAPVRDIPGFRYLDIAIDSADLLPDA